MFSAVSLVFSAFALKGVTAVTLVQPIPTSFPPAPTSLPPTTFSIPTGFSIPGFSVPTGFSIPSFSVPTSIPSVSLVATVSIGGVADDATTYFREEIIGINGDTSTLTQTIVQGASVWRDDGIHESCSLDGKGGAVCVLGPESFQTTFTGSAVPVTTLAADAAAGGSGGGSAGSGAGTSGGAAGAGSGGSAGAGGSGGSAGANPTGSAPSGSAPSGSAPSGSSARANGGASVAMLVGTVAAAVAAGIRIAL